MTDTILAGAPEGKGWSGNALSLAVHIAAGAGALVILLFINSAARITAANRAAVPPRWHYVVLSVLYFGCAAGVYEAGAAALAGSSWLGDVTAVLVFWSVVFALAMLGRAAFRGRTRRLFWWYRPQWLDTTSGLSDSVPPADALS